MNFIEVEEAARLLKEGELVVIPTDTVYGLAGIATSKTAIDNIYEVKNRPKDNPLICHFYSVDQIKKYAYLSKIEEELLKYFTPGPLTLLLKAKSDELKYAIANQKRIGCRIPDSKLTLQLIKEIGIPLAAPSANPSGMPSSTTKEMAEFYFKKFNIKVLNDDESKHGLESTILNISNQCIQIFRPGSIGENELRKFLKLKGFEDYSIEAPTNSKTVIPGAKYRHYSPGIPVVKIDYISEIDSSKNFVLLTSEKKLNIEENKIIEIPDNSELLSQRLYQIMHDLSKKNYDLAYWYTPELFKQDDSITLALRDRLSKIFE